MRGKDAPKDIAVLAPAPMQREVASPRRAPRAKPEKTAAAPYVSPETVAQTTDENGRAVIPAPTVSATASRERNPELDNLSPISVTHEKPERIAEPYMPPTGRTAAPEPVSEAAPARDEIVVAAVADSQRTASQPAVPRPAAQPPAAQRPANPAPPRSSSSPSPADSYALHLASYRGPETAEAGWDIYKEQFADVLASLRPVGVAVTLPEKGDYIRLLAGPISDLHAARLACEELAARDQYCQVMHYDGSSL